MSTNNLNKSTMEQLKKMFLSFALLLTSTIMYAQNEISGTVVDRTGETVIGATVMEKGTSNGTITDFDGNFKIKVNEGATLVISYIGYQTMEMPAVDGMKVILKDDAEVLQEVVVTGYTTQRKADLTGAISTVSVDEMAKQNENNPMKALQGRVPGMNIQADGNPSGAATVRIRGVGTLNDNDPLYIIDGVPTKAGMHELNGNDIESIQVLKDAASASIYGSRAANGVIIITTKKGQAGRMKVSYSGNVKLSTRTKDVDVMSAESFKQFVMAKFGAGSPQVAAIGSYDTDWQKEIYRTALSTDHNVSLSGSLPNTPYRVSVGYTNENGIIKTSSMDRLTGTITLNPQLFDKHLNIQLNVKGIYTTNRFPDMGAVNMATQYDPTQPINMSGSQYGNGYFMYLNPVNGLPIDIGLTNPVSMLDCKSDKSTVYRSIGNAQFDYKFHFLPELRANLNLGYDVSKGEGDVVIDDNSPMTWCAGNYKAGFGENSKYWQLKRNLLLEFYLDYANTFGVHNIDVMAGYSWQHFYKSEWTKYPYSEKYAKEKGTEYYKDMEDIKTENYLISFFGRLNYTLLDRYLFTFTLRDDGSSRFSKENRWGLFPSVALAWRINDEPFMRNVKSVSDLKLRLGYGVTGQQNLNNGDYPYMPRYSYSKAGANYYFGNTKYRLIAPQPYDENLKWEETTTYNIGLDFGFLNNKITGTLDYYYRKTDNLLNTVTAPAGTNFSNELLTNVGTLENKGFEFSLNVHPVDTKDWHWTISYNFTYNKNEITKLTFNDDPAYKGVIHGDIDGATGYKIQINAVNYPYNSFYVFEQMYDTDGKPIEGAYVDQNGDNKIDEEDLIVYKKSAPDVYMGLNNQISYKNWDLAFAVRASFGNYVYNNVQSNREAWDGSQMYDQSGFLKNRLESAWDHDFRAGQYRSSYYVQNASFFRMDNITLGYTFQKLFNDKQTARVYFTVQNPFVITKYSGLDPEISGEGIDKELYPRPRSFMLGVNLNF